MAYTLNSTAEYHRNRLDSLGWELTMCNSLEPRRNPCRELLAKTETYGNLLYDFLDAIAGIGSIKRVLEIGGGYGCLMRDFLARNPLLKASMLDISPYLLERQRKALAGPAAQGRAQFIEQDFLETGPKLPASFDLVIMNENLGDFPTLDGIERRFFYSPLKQLDGHLLKARRFFLKYNLDIPHFYPFSFNVGAVAALEKLCSCGVKYIFVSEHSCETCRPGPPAAPSGRRALPERIRLKGHDEYTVKFSFLEKVASYYGYDCRRGPMADYLQVDPAVDTRAVAGGSEAARHFLEDLYVYEYLFLSKKT